ncbi:MULTISPECIES: hypothetical protein [Nostoc]|uniref:Uncharacterized protein n=1 Tax=Nostoc paludosum FACHB-159 TaxID=2692908 RepID=A0ABR8KAJ7_9NOSO|nr:MULTISPECIES: hypothetical protein [Nostoc]MBD2680807.1 hypothetical protein [Nostoc sp. FACHB-857]MBD2736562.1 hypothetical protein [Nostoc paludosum FACHB-159]
MLHEFYRHQLLKAGVGFIGGAAASTVLLNNCPSVLAQSPSLHIRNNITFRRRVARGGWFNLALFAGLLIGISSPAKGEITNLRQGELYIKPGELYYGLPNGIKTYSSYLWSNRSCFIEFDGLERQMCQVAREGKSCFIAMESGLPQQLCEAYREGKSCFIAINSEKDRSWCEHFKEGKSCFMALNGKERELCEEGLIPLKHFIWLS